jgi:hypothetical protein
MASLDVLPICMGYNGGGWGLGRDIQVGELLAEDRHLLDIPHDIARLQIHLLDLFRGQQARPQRWYRALRPLIELGILVSVFLGRRA